ncbi:hypothetical protein JQ557_16860 [Bradyrhizobium sp. U87765 SZCCT0131]|uniref:hypothetical protein n=1 Tax=unclassified Bradyrhizobium TaxID=2631580 RepID=UPI001BA798A7|nr:MULTISPECIES: hypothetical protein [unclassified Bradyrhizobium]MBR1219680.1 hypothetical protein [Bradyrhizobium sp. U87765 SZCCT0131]MBR1262331.1 hypothetical protein [Bradyrhizobium sp. U87765 SZCCT0134]MBR1308486.1 hypothetical protein [Bradyrhizobium sp. U87765 SZCCT0110]MBR1318113.1 hypothetical protein [Bradyrhizobium sp. U87765 SZCCT0109]MBR1351816.1 hypothetical protein [Bradyrhizobium sp. U87765 SZCCT0048]
MIAAELLTNRGGLPAIPAAKACRHGFGDVVSTEYAGAVNTRGVAFMQHDALSAFQIRYTRWRMDDHLLRSVLRPAPTDVEVHVIGDLEGGLYVRAAA